MERNKCIDKRFRGSNYPLTMHALDLPHRGGGLIKKPRTIILLTVVPVSLHYGSAKVKPRTEEEIVSRMIYQLFAPR